LQDAAQRRNTFHQQRDALDAAMHPVDTTTVPPNKDTPERDPFQVLEQSPNTAGALAVAPPDGVPPACSSLEFDDAENACTARFGASALDLTFERAARRPQSMLATLVESPGQMLPDEVLGLAECESAPVSPVKGERVGVVRGAVSAKVTPLRGSAKPPLSPSRPSLLVRGRACCMCLGFQVAAEDVAD
jgi:hypothetical protein